MKKRMIYGLLVSVLVANLYFGARIYFGSALAADRDDSYPNIALFMRVMDMVRKDYVDGDKLSYENLIHGALKGMLGTLDPHSEFMDAAKFEELRKDTEGEFGGVGIVVGVRDGFLTVVSPIEDTPGHKAGIMTGDRIVKIDGKSTENLSIQDAVKVLRGEPGTKLSLQVLRSDDTGLHNYELVRAVIKVETVKDINGKCEFPLLEDQIGYIRISQFGEKTSDELSRAIRELRRRDMRALIIDVRDNPGGLLEQAVKVCEKFLPREQLIVSTEGRGASQRMEHRSTGRDVIPKMHMVVLVNGGSASASEIVAGCLQDLKRAIVVGEQTFGKGSVQSILPLQDGSALRLTTAKYYTPSHKVIHERGITPDIMVPLSSQEEDDLAIRRQTGGVEALEEPERDRIKGTRDRQLERAIDLLKGIHVFTETTRPAVKAVAQKAAD